MNSIATASTRGLKSIVKESVREVFEEELMKFRAILLPTVSSKEQKEIEKLYGQPGKKVARVVHVNV